MLHLNQRAPLSGKADSAVLLFHGLGADGADLISLADEWGPLLPNTEFLAPDAPNPCDMGPFGYQWFSLQEASPAAILAGVKQAAPVIDGFIDEILASRKLTPDRVALVGFSQGTMMSLYVAPRRAESLAGVLGYSGILIGAEELLTEKKTAPEVLLFHGTMDPVLPYRALAEAEKGLKTVGIPVSSVTCPGLGHGIDGAGVEQGVAFLRKVLKAA